MKKMVIRITALCIVLSIISFFALSGILYIKTFRRRETSTLLNPNGYRDEDTRLSAAMAIMAADNERITITAQDGTHLVAHYYERTPGAPLIIFFHGYRSHAVLDGTYMYELTRKTGWNILLVTSRAHGESGGDYSTVGVKESHDCRDWAVWAQDRFGDDAQVFLMGISISGTTVLMSAALDMPEVVRGIIDDSGFTTYKDTCLNSAKSVLPQWVPPELLMFGLECSARIYGHFSLYDVNALRAVGQTDIPILFIHGDEDQSTPVSMAYKLYEKCSSKKRLLIIHGAGHAGNNVIAPRTYANSIIRFVKENIV